MRKPGLLLALILSTAWPAVAEKPLFTASTEVERPHERDAAAAPALIRLVLASLDRDDVDQLDNCIAEQRLPAGGYGPLLGAVRIRSGPGRALWFVRPALRPYCRALYGAHLFRYFLFEDRSAAARSRYRLVFQGGGDQFAVYPTLRHGRNDIAATGCTADDCWTERFSYDGRSYRPIRCTHMGFDASHEVTRPVRCPRGG
jgi:hypothetical protein